MKFACDKTFGNSMTFLG